MTRDAAPLVLVVEDERPMRRLVKASLVDQGYRVAEADRGEEALSVAASQPPDVVVLDLGLPDMDGLEFIDRLRDWSTAPIVVLSARDREADRVEALDRGADDFLTKPFGIEELHARIRVALRHAARMADRVGEPEFRAGNLRVDLASRRVSLDEKEVRLTPIEYRLLATLVRHAGRVLTHRQILREVWGPGHDHDTHYVRVYVAALRRRLEEDPARPRYLLTEQGVGYRLVDEPPRVGET